MYVYRIKIGDLHKRDSIIATGLYSGNHEHFNDPLAQHLSQIGPIPEGVYVIGEFRDTTEHGPYFIPLISTGREEAYGRFAFGMHGDRIGHVGEHLASNGCVIAPLDVRHIVGADVGHLFVVISGNW